MTNQIIKLDSDASKNNIEQIAVIGGGLAGLTAAVFLARDGKNVTIIEKASEVGGRARSLHFRMDFTLIKVLTLYMRMGLDPKFWKN